MTQAASSDDNAVNLATIQKTDKLCCEVLDKCTSSALYRYAGGKWEQCNCDGVFLLYRRSVPPLYAFIVLNKRSTQNHVQHITKAMGLQLQPPFLLYRTESGEVHGMWFFTPRDCQRIAARVGQLVVSLGGESLRVAATAATAAAATAAAGKGKPAAAAKQQQPPQQQHQQAAVAAPAAPPTAAAAATGAEMAQSILQMLSRAQTDFKQQHHTHQQQARLPQPKVISVDSLFGGSQQPVQPQLPQAAVINGDQRDQYAEMSHQIKEHLGLVTGLQKSQPPQPQPPPPTLLLAQSRPGEADANNEEEEFLLTPGMLECAANQILTDCPQPALAAAPPQSPPQPQAKPLPPQQQHQQHHQQHQQQHQQPPVARGGAGDVPALTKEQLRECLIYMLEEDDAFLTSLHRAYVASLQRRLARPI